jgi:hypothetical protein
MLMMQHNGRDAFSESEGGACPETAAIRGVRPGSNRFHPQMNVLIIRNDHP